MPYYCRTIIIIVIPTTYLPTLPITIVIIAILSVLFPTCLPVYILSTARLSPPDLISHQPCLNCEFCLSPSPWLGRAPGALFFNAFPLLLFGLGISRGAKQEPESLRSKTRAPKNTRAGRVKPKITATDLGPVGRVHFSDFSSCVDLLLSFSRLPAFARVAITCLVLRASS